MDVPHIPAHSLPTPTHGSGGRGSFTVACGTHINAPPLACFRIVLHGSSYPEWNRFCRRCIPETGSARQQRASGDSLMRAQTGSVAVDRDGQTAAADGDAIPAGPGYLTLGTKFVFDVHMDLDEEAGSADANNQTVTGRATSLEVSILEAITADQDDGGDRNKTQRRSDSETVLGDRKRKTGIKRGKGWRVAWKTRGMPGWMLCSERVQEFWEADDGSGTEYVCWETFYGMLAPVVRWAVGEKLKRGFGAWSEDLKKRAEGGTVQEGPGQPDIN
ncbi:hypothetical protein VTK73DRAFT_8174 [Phialemonium thermophilum]|uniref:Uncharacterized protein n=1 Tax=Phialemonium thermophilum TaxID=223376 RepID=A0ABR3WAI2_9PEZI